MIDVEGGEPKDGRPKDDSGERDTRSSAERLRACAGTIARRVRSGLVRENLLAALCLVVALLLAAPWVRVPVAELVGREVAYSVPDLLATGQLFADRAQSVEDLVERARETAERAGQIIERAQDAVERAADAREGRD